MRRRPLTSLLVVLILASAAFVATLWSGNTPNLGLDLQGGIAVVLQPVVDGKPADEVPAENLNQTKTIIEQRVNGLGVAEAEVTVQGRNILVQIPGIKDPETALSLIEKTAEMRFRPVLADLGVEPGPEDLKKIERLRKKLKIPEGTTALAVYNAELEARGQPTIPDPNAPVTTVPDPNTPVPTVPDAVETPPTTVATGDGTGGSRSAKSFAVRRQEGTTTTGSTTTTSTTTTTINPAPQNPFGVQVYADEKGTLTKDLTELLALEDQVAKSKIETTPPEDDKADAEVVLKGSPITSDDGKTLIPRYRLGPALLTGSAVEDAKAGLSQGGGWEVRPVFKAGAKGIDLFNDAAAKCYNADPSCPTRQLGIVLDGEVISAPSINAPNFQRDQIQITGSFSEEEARNLALALRYGSLPLTLEPQQVQTVSATLGEGALRAGLIAGAIGVGLVCLFLVAYYRLAGLVTVGALLVAVMLMWTFIVVMGATIGLTLTLSGIVGIIVSIGVSLDSDIVYYETLKEDVRNGKTMRTAMERSYSTAFATIVKADVASLIGAAVLYLFSIGPVRGFAFFLGFSTIVDLITSYFFTRPLMATLGRTRLAHRPALFGIPTWDLEQSVSTPSSTTASPAGGR
jgi:preprotein translocase subunit SecD